MSECTHERFGVLHGVQAREGRPLIRCVGCGERWPITMDIEEDLKRLAFDKRWDDFMLLCKRVVERADEVEEEVEEEE